MQPPSADPNRRPACLSRPPGAYRITALLKASTMAVVATMLISMSCKTRSVRSHGGTAVAAWHGAGRQTAVDVGRITESFLAMTIFTIFLRQAPKGGLGRNYAIL